MEAEAEEVEENQKMYGLMRAKETKEVEKDLVSRERERERPILAWPVFIVSVARKIICQLCFYDTALQYSISEQYTVLYKVYIQL